MSQMGWISDHSWEINSVSSRRDNRSGLGKFISEAYPLGNSCTSISLGSILELLPPAVSKRFSIHTSKGSLPKFSWTCFLILDEFLLFLDEWIYTELRFSWNPFDFLRLRTSKIRIQHAHRGIWTSVLWAKEQLESALHDDRYKIPALRHFVKFKECEYCLGILQH